MINKNESIKWICEQWIERELKPKFDIDERIKDVKKNIRGVYGIFVMSNEKCYCAYIGRSSNIYKRIFGPNGHITRLRSDNKYPNNRIKEAMKSKNAVIQIRIMQEVPLVGDNYYKDMQRLASAECWYIDYYQGMNQCLEQTPEGTRMTECEWINNTKEI